MFARLFWLASALILLLAGCDQASRMSKFASENEQAVAKGYIDQLRAHDFETIEKSLDKRIVGSDIRDTLEKMSALIPESEPRSIKLVGAQKYSQNGVTSLNTTFEYQFPEGWLLVNVAIEKRDGTKVITGFNVYPRTQSLEEENRFSLVGKQPIHYFVLAGMIAAVLISLYALVACMRSKALSKKWLWILFILVGMSQLKVNWTSGAWGIVPLSIQLLSAGVVAQPYGPLILSFSIPVGAIVFLLYGRKKKGVPVES